MKRKQKKNDSTDDCVILEIPSLKRGENLYSGTHAQLFYPKR